MDMDGKGLGTDFEQAASLNVGDIITIGGRAMSIVDEYRPLISDPEATTVAGMHHAKWYDHVCHNWQCNNKWSDQTECAQCPLCGSEAS